MEVRPAWASVEILDAELAFDFAREAFLHVLCFLKNQAHCRVIDGKVAALVIRRPLVDDVPAEDGINVRPARDGRAACTEHSDEARACLNYGNVSGASPHIEDGNATNFFEIVAICERCRCRLVHQLNIGKTSRAACFLDGFAL